MHRDSPPPGPPSHYGSLEKAIRAVRAARPMDLNHANWRKNRKFAAYSHWKIQAANLLRRGLHYENVKCEMEPAVLDTVETGIFRRERIEFNTSPWFRVPGYFYTPLGCALPAPGLVVMHEWGGPMLFGSERVCGAASHPVILEHRKTYSGGRALADFFASNGYCVVVIDAYHFGRRAPRGAGGLPDEFDAFSLDPDTFSKYEELARGLLYLGVRQLNWAGKTWCGVNYADDSRCVDYLLSRPEVDGGRIGATGLSGGGWRTNILAALDGRVSAAVPVGWMTTGDRQQAYNVEGAVGTFCLLPGVWDRIDVPDLISMSAPAACMVVSGRQDPLFPPGAGEEAASEISRAYRWAGCPEKFKSFTPDKPHCYDEEIQREALGWFDRHLKGLTNTDN